MSNEGRLLIDETAVEPKLAQLKTKLRQANGIPIPLNKPVSGEKQLVVSNRFSRRDAVYEGNPLYSHLLIGAYIGNGADLRPIGFNDWLIQDDIGVHKNVHVTESVTLLPHEQLMAQFGREQWGYAFYTDPDFQGQGIGTLLAAVALATLDGLGVKQLRSRPGMVTPSAQAVWRKFGLELNTTFPPLHSLATLRQIDTVLATVA